MRQLSFAAVAVTLLAADPALAADLAEPPVIDTPSLIPHDDMGSGWYLRGDLSYDRAQRPGFSFPAASPVHVWKGSNDLSAGFGVGYEFNEWFRSDLTVDYLSRGTGVRPVTNATNTVTAYGSSRLEVLPVLLNGYIDFAAFGGLTPYVGAGVGFAGVSLSAMTANWTTAGPVNHSYTFGESGSVTPAAAAMAGVSYDLGSSLRLDLGYRYLWVKDAKTSNGSIVNNGVTTAVGPAKYEDLDFHQFRLGLRYFLF